MTAAAPAGYRVVEVPESRKAELLHVDHLAFAFEPDAETSAQVPMTLEWDRTVGVEAPDGTLAAVHGSFRLVLPVPGGAVPCAGLTWVGTRPDQRRRGLLSTMIDTHFARSLARGEPVSALYAAEPGIYGRFGYGSAATDVRLTVPRGAALRPVPGSDALGVRFEKVDADVHGPLVERVHAAAGSGRPGWITRDTDALRRKHLADPPAWRDGAEPLRVVTVLAGDEPRGYALLRRKEAWTDGRPATVVRMHDLAALDAAAAHRLWSVVLDLDLTSVVETPMLAPDDVLLQLLVDPRGPRPRVADNLWLRVLDVRAALAARRWSAPVDVVLDVRDARLPANAGRWRLTTGEPGPHGTWDARVEPTHEPADVALDVRELGAVYLGGRSLGALGRAGLVTELAPGTLHRASAAFGWPLAPVCSWAF
ncbi:GNAT family N-acetyltransferase [Cellulomonas cellasea]|uniref:Putative acetyltransferase n=1 Tax=Cellulomonas cellasea TaxID=43670 RepID=A0A7W4UIT3_9CELL|nr:GNAT family N-acetyltransferase [Cellulomonas cellasea]MBB2924942.1 putative acetyltransferase [Cellulomonas cellasea]